MRIRSATAADAAMLSDFGAQAFRAAFAAANDPADIQAYLATAFTEQRLGEELAEQGARFLLAYDDGDEQGPPLGYAHLRVGATADGVDGAAPVELARIYIHPDRTGGGHGTALLAACLQEARRAGGDVLWLGVWEHNAGARRFYARHGFRVVGAQRFLLGGDEQTDQVMARPLDR